MKRCLQCNIDFKEEDRYYCLYCDSPLVDAARPETVKFVPVTSVREKSLRLQEPKNLRGVLDLAGRFFKIKSFFFSYSLCRNQFKRGRKFPRFLVQPMDISFIIKIPLAVVDVVDSILFRFIYEGYCETCQWKYPNTAAHIGHSPYHCDYNREYALILDEISKGTIVHQEEKFEQLANLKVSHGKHSAYRDLFSRRKTLEFFVDVSMIIFSLSLVVFLAAKAVMPVFGLIYDF